MLIDELGGALTTLFAPIYKDGLLKRAVIEDNGKGGSSAADITDVPCKVQVAALTQSQRAAGFTESDVRLLILAGGLDQWLEDGRVLDDDEVRVLGKGGATYRIAGPLLDPAGSHWTCRGRVKP